jgi:hypothetical protein
MAQGATLALYDGDIYTSYAEAKKSDTGGLATVYLEYANDDTMSQTAVWDALEIIQAALKVVGKDDAQIRYVLLRDGEILDC